jgi:hypothetical protein
MMRKGNSLIMSTLKNTGTHYESTFINFITRSTIKSVLHILAQLEHSF